MAPLKVKTITEHDHIYLNEMFTSIEGEGIFAGVPTIFIRFQGCSVKCSYCDTKESWAKLSGEPVFINYVVQNTIKTLMFTYPGINRISITGGNPIEQLQGLNNLVDLIKTETHAKLHIEHPGVFINDPQEELKVLSKFDSICFDIKSPMSNTDKNNAELFYYTQARILSAVVSQLKLSSNKPVIQIKAVFKDQDEFDFYKNIVKEYPILISEYFLLSPMFTTKPEDWDNTIKFIPQVIPSSEFINKVLDKINQGVFGLNCRVSLQIHKFLNVL